MFDLKKYLAQVAHMDEEEVKETVLHGSTVGFGLEEYLNETHQAGAEILSRYITGPELNHLLAMVAGVSTGHLLGSSEIPGGEKLFLASAMTSHPDLLKAIALSILCSATGIINKEEWR